MVRRVTVIYRVFVPMVQVCLDVTPPVLFEGTLRLKTGSIRPSPSKSTPLYTRKRILVPKRVGSCNFRLCSRFYYIRDKGHTTLYFRNVKGRRIGNVRVK